MNCCDVVFSRNRVEEKKYISDIVREFELISTHPPKPGQLPYAAIEVMRKLVEGESTGD